MTQINALPLVSFTKFAELAQNVQSVSNVRNLWEGEESSPKKGGQFKDNYTNLARSLLLHKAAAGADPKDLGLTFLTGDGAKKVKEAIDKLGAGVTPEELGLNALTGDAAKKVKEAIDKLGAGVTPEELGLNALTGDENEMAKAVIEIAKASGSGWPGVPNNIRPYYLSNS
ncbi:hypothetical protein BLL37_13175 [Pseudomonas azotoformans]|uniref:Uncharacterized protein n=1 Tax=Pseudomonas azotoformans TaxID=47878 RepID=A0A1V2JKH3_PSEAZ|nr:hypothetical protein [Pseudomonas azotoformans]OIN48200.1 hypothetical protein BFL39_13945 [Pseudomonas azotoformans]ONH45918.1 hypothetical protein BLL37_13175 [Pseudomonas azotoformans]SDO15342.1 hypothetical protein SAMN04489799_3867 [Pseudomonas azotoformans]